MIHPRESRHRHLCICQSHRNASSSFKQRNQADHTRRQWEVSELSPDELADRARAALIEEYGPASEHEDVTYIPNFPRHLSHALQALRPSQLQQRSRGCVLVGPRGSGRKGVLRAACCMCGARMQVMDGMSESNALEMMDRAVVGRMQILFVVSLRAGLIARPAMASRILSMCKCEGHDDAHKAGLSGVRFAILVDRDVFMLSEGRIMLPSVMTSLLRFFTVDWYQGWSDDALARSIHLAGEGGYKMVTRTRRSIPSLHERKSSRSVDTDAGGYGSGQDKIDDKPARSTASTEGVPADDAKCIKPWRKQYSEAMFRTHRCIEQAALSVPSAGLHKWFSKSAADDYPPPQLGATFARTFAHNFVAKVAWKDARKAKLQTASRMYESVREHAESLGKKRSLLMPQVRDCVETQKRWRTDTLHYARYVKREG
jgi:hypothetical protein